MPPQHSSQHLGQHGALHRQRPPSSHQLCVLPDLLISIQYTLQCPLSHSPLSKTHVYPVSCRTTLRPPLTAASV